MFLVSMCMYKCVNKWCVFADNDNYEQLLGSLDYAYLFAYAVGMFLR